MGRSGQPNVTTTRASRP